MTSSDASIPESQRLKRAFLALEKMQSKLDALERARTEPLAVVAMACRLPGQAESPEAFWNLLRQGTDAIGEVPQQRWNVDEYFDPDPDAPGKMVTRHGGFLQQVDGFDASFFGISPREALHLDPQQRLLLEICWEAIEHAGIAADRLRSTSTGVFVGICAHDYSQRLLAGGSESVDTYTATGNAHSVAAGRLSFLLGLQGPSLAVDTACSSSLVAVHLACQALRGNECDLALAGGVNLILTPELSISFSRARMLAPDGRCKTFDAAADGFARGEGAGVVVLKRLTDALVDADPILAVIQGSAINHDGHSSGLTVPNGLAQQQVIRRALDNAGVEPNQIGYVEAHGTGTPLGDPIELAALGAVFGPDRPRGQPLLVGSVKTNIGHLEAAAGIAGLIKVILALQHRQIPPHLHFHQPSAHIPWDELPVAIPTNTTPWASPDSRRLAGVSSFGFGGTNAHVILAEPPEPSGPEAVDGCERPCHVLALSACDPEALQQLAGRYAAHVAARTDWPLADAAFTANCGRQHFSHRLAFVAGSAGEACEKLQQFARGQVPPGGFRAVAEAASPPIAFLFSGQGAQYAEMARELDRSQPRFRQTLDECDALLSAWLERPLREVLYGATGGEALLKRTAFTQPALFAIEYALAGLWREWGVEPRYLLGHSIGEYVAACLAGVFDLPGALKLVASRGRLMDRLPAGGAMAAVGADRSTVQAALGAGDSGCVVVAADNGPRQVVISGPLSAVRAVVARLSGAGVRSRLLSVSHAFHSPLVEPMLEQYASVVGQVPLSAPRRHMISNVTGRLAGEELATVDYWCRQIRQPVEFAAGMRTLASLGCRAFLEVGPGTALVNLGRQCLKADADLLWAASLRPERADSEVLGESLSALYVRGVPVDWRAWDGAYARRKVSLPRYPFQRQRYWVEGTGGAKASVISGHSGSAHPLLGRRLSTAGQEVLFEGRLSAREPAYLGDHRVGGAVLFPASGFAELALAAGASVSPDASLCVEDMTLEQALPLSDASPAILQTVLTPLPDDHWRFQLFQLNDHSSGTAPRWVRHAVARLAPRQQTPESGVTDRVDFESFGVDRFRPDDIYQRLALAGLHYGENFRILRAIRRGHAAVMAEICLPDSLSDSLTDYRLHPVLLDGAFQLLAVLTDGVAESDTSFLPIGMGRIEWYRPPERRLYAQLRIVSGELSEASLVDLRIDVELFSLQHERIARVEGLRLQRVDRLRLTRAMSEDTSDWLYEVVWRRRAGRAAPRGEAADRDGKWLLLADSTGVADRLAADLVGRGQRCVLFRARGEYARVSEEEYYVRPSVAEDFQTAVAQLCGQDAPACRGVVHLWSLDSPFAVDPGLDSLSETQRLACASTLHLVQALVGQKPIPRLWLVTRGAQAVDSQSGVRDVAQATLWGFGRVLPLEHPDLRTVLVDLDAESSSAAAADEILIEILEPDDEQQVAYRQAARWVARLVHYRPPARGGAPSVRGDATYLITGGRGALGQHVARWLTSRGARHLVLAGRRAMGSAAAREQAEALAAAGVEVRMLDVDVSVAADVDRLMDEIAGCMPPLRGIVHAAGILDDGIILQQNWQRVGRVLAPKVQGAWNLHERTKDLSLDFFVAFSSMASLLGSPGQVGYAAANAFLDVLAHYRLQLGLVGLTVNWGPWDEAGMAATRGEHDQARRIAAGIGLLSPHQGLNLLLRLLDQPVPDVGVMPVDWPRFFRQRPGDSLLGELDQTAGDRDWQEPAILSRWEGASPSERQTLVENYLRTEIGRVLRLKPDDVQMQRSLVGMGLDSLMAMELRNRVLKDLGVEIPLAAFIDELPVTGFAVMMVDQLVHKLSDSPPCPSTAGSAGNGEVEWLEGEL